jgi:hypothetical protein
LIKPNVKQSVQSKNCLILVLCKEQLQELQYLFLNRRRGHIFPSVRISTKFGAEAIRQKLPGEFNLIRFGST